MLRPRGETGYGQRAQKETWKDRTQGPLGTGSFGATHRVQSVADGAVYAAKTVNVQACKYIGMYIVSMQICM